MPLIPRRLKPKKQDSTPTRQVTGTSYAASGAPNIKPPDLTEIGSSIASPLVDPIPDVGNPSQARITYTKMARDDATVRMALRAGKAPVLGAEWFVEPYSDDPLDLSIREFVEFNLFYGMTVSWVKVLEQVLTMYENGKSVFEPVWENREWAPRKTNAGANRRVYTMLRKLSFRPASTIGQVTYDNNGGPVSIRHVAVDSKGTSKEVDLPIEKLVVFTFDQQGGGLEGMPILRSAYKHWYYKNILYKIDAIQKERHGIGVPDIEIGPGASPADIAAAHQLGANLHANEKSYVAHPPTIKVGFLKLEGQPVDVLKSIEHHDDQIMKSVMVQFLNLGMGTGGGGGRATGATGMDMFMKAMRHISDSICDAINMYLIPNMVAYNFPTDNFPKLSTRGVGEVKDMQMWSAAIRNLLDADAISLDEDTEQWIRQQIDAPRLTTPWTPPSERPEKVQELIQTSGSKNGNGNSSGSGNTSKNGGAGNVPKSPSSGAV